MLLQRYTAPHGIPSSGQPLTEYSFTQAAQLQVSVLEGVFQFLIQRLLFALQQNGGASVQDPLGGALHNQQVTRLARIGILMYGQLRRDKKVVLGNFSEGARRQRISSSGTEAALHNIGTIYGYTQGCQTEGR